MPTGQGGWGRMGRLSWVRREVGKKRGGIQIYSVHACVFSRFHTSLHTSLTAFAADSQAMSAVMGCLLVTESIE